MSKKKKERKGKKTACFDRIVRESKNLTLIKIITTWRDYLSRLSPFHVEQIPILLVTFSARNNNSIL